MKVYLLSIILAPSSSTSPSGSSTPPSKSSIILGTSNDLSSFPFFQRGTYAEFMTFFSVTLAERTPLGGRQCINEKGYSFHVYKRSVPENLAAVVVTDTDYPDRPAFSLLTKLLDDFTGKFPESSFSNPLSVPFEPEIKSYITRYQDPRQEDTIMKVQQELDETKIVLHKTIESVLQRGEKLEDLVDRSNTLSAQSKMFYKTAKNQNSCCVIM